MGGRKEGGAVGGGMRPPRVSSSVDFLQGLSGTRTTHGVELCLTREIGLTMFKVCAYCKVMDNISPVEDGYPS